MVWYFGKFYLIRHLAPVQKIRKEAGIPVSGSRAGSSMKKVLILSNHSYMFWQFRRELVQAMLDLGCEVTLAVPFGDRTQSLEKLGISMIDTPMNRRGISPHQERELIRQYREILDTQQPELVLTYSIKPNIYAGILCARRNIPYCMNIQGVGSAFQRPASAGVVSALYRAAARKAKVVFFENEDNARMFRERKIIRPQQQRILRGAGINLSHYHCRPYPENEKVHFLYLGRLMREKGIGELFSAVRRLHTEGESFHLDVVGFFEERHLTQLEELTKLGICTFHGFQMETRPYYAETDCVVLPSYHEGMCNVLLEGAAMGRPLLTSDIPGCREAVEEGVTGFTCPARDAEALYRLMKHFLQLPREQRAAMGRAGRQRMERYFDKNQVIRQTLDAIFGEEMAVPKG